jgi:polyisoprenoid-binding protein YceI
MQKFVQYLFALVALSFCSPAYAADHYEFDKEHSHILFFVNHLGFSNMLGMYTDYQGSFEFDKDHPQASSVDVTLHPKGIKTTSEILDRVLQGENFFNTNKYSDMHFVSSSTKVTGDHKGDLSGNLTMLGITKPITLHVVFNKSGYHPITNLYIAGFSATADIKRSDFGMSYLIPMVGDDVHIQIEVEAVNINRKEAEKLKH